MKNRVILDFPTEDDATNFLGYFSDGGGEAGAHETDVMHGPKDGSVLSFNYDKAFYGWGYSPERDGEDRVVKVTRHDTPELNQYD